MILYKDFSPSRFDPKGLSLEDKQEWLVLPCAHNRDSDCLTESNFYVAEKMLEKIDPEGNDHSNERFGHWANGWFEIIVVRPNTPAAKEAERIQEKLNDYPVLDEDDFSEREYKAAQETWRNCYSERERIDYIRDHKDQFEFQSFADMLQCVRGTIFAGSCSELIRE